jgi:hypothetical protein
VMDSAPMTRGREIMTCHSATLLQQTPGSKKCEQIRMMGKQTGSGFWKGNTEGAGGRPGRVSSRGRSQLEICSE